MTSSAILPKTTVFDLLRHGQPQGGSCLLGSTDHPLTKEGWQQLRIATSPNPGWTKIISSPLCRCAEFAKEFSKENKLPLTVMEEWQEISFGEWDGKGYQEIYQEYPNALSAFWDAPRKNTPPGGEPLDEFSKRIHQAWLDLIQQSGNEHILLVTHSGVIRQVLAHILDIPDTSTAPTTRIHTPYASLCRIEVYTDETGKHWPRLMSLGS